MQPPSSRREARQREQARESAFRQEEFCSEGKTDSSGYRQERLENNRLAQRAWGHGWLFCSQTISFYEMQVTFPQLYWVLSLHRSKTLKEPIQSRGRQSFKLFQWSCVKLVPGSKHSETRLQAKLVPERKHKCIRKPARHQQGYTPLSCDYLDSLPLKYCG